MKRTLARVFAVCCLLGAVALSTVVGCTYNERFADQQAHLEAIDQRLDAQDRFLETLRVDLFLEVRRLSEQIRGLDKFIENELKGIGTGFQDVRGRIKELDGILNKLPGGWGEH
jgi:hypothetical protein